MFTQACRRKFSLLVLTALILLSTGCSFNRFETVASAKERIIEPEVTDAELTELVEGNNRFALNLYPQLPDSGNLCYSPYSLSVALAMTYAGARGQTKAQMAETLHFTLPPKQFHTAFNALDLALNQRELTSLLARPREKSDEKPPAFRLYTPNAIWAQAGYPILPEYLDLLSENYGAGVRLLDFGEDPEAARHTINAWVSRQTEDQIPEILPMNSIDSQARLVLTNVILFEAQWHSPFKESNTKDGKFFLLDGSMVTVPLMSQENEEFPYAEGDNYQAVQLPYLGDRESAAMLILLPNPNHFQEFEQTLTADKVADIVANLFPHTTNLTMPKFRFSSPIINFKEVLITMGMTDAFDMGEADFSGIDGRKNDPKLFLKDIFHRTFITVDEEGTAAAGASAVVMHLLSFSPTPEVDLIIDRPFFFIIRDLKTGAILFVGRVLDPSSDGA